MKDCFSSAREKISNSLIARLIWAKNAVVRAVNNENAHDAIDKAGKVAAEYILQSWFTDGFVGELLGLSTASAESESSLSEDIMSADNLSTIQTIQRGILISTTIEVFFCAICTI